MDSSSGASAAMFEHMAKLSRLTDHAPQQGAPPLRFRSAVIPMSEVEAAPPGDVNGSDIPAPPGGRGSEREKEAVTIRLQSGAVPIRLRTDVLGEQRSSYEHKSESPTSKRPRSKQRKRDTPNPNANNADTCEHGDTSETGNRRERHLAAVSEVSQEEPTASGNGRASVSEIEGSRRHSPKSERKSGKAVTASENHREASHGDRSIRSSHDKSGERAREEDRDDEKHSRRQSNRTTGEEPEPAKRDDRSERKDKPKRKSRMHRNNAVGDVSDNTGIKAPADHLSAMGSPSPRRTAAPMAGSPAGTTPTGSHPASVHDGTPVKSALSSRRTSGGASPDEGSSLEERALQEKRINKQRYRSRDRDNYDHREVQRLVEEKLAGNGGYPSDDDEGRHKKRHRGRGVTVKKVNTIVGPKPVLPPSPAVTRMAEARSQRWKKPPEESTVISEELKRGRNMRAAPRTAHGSDDRRQVAKKDQTSPLSPSLTLTPPRWGANSHALDPQILLDQLIRASDETARTLDAEVAAKQLIHASYEEEEQKSHSARDHEEVELRNHVQRHLDSRFRSRDVSNDCTPVACHLKTGMDTEKVTELLMQAFPLANVTTTKILRAEGDAKGPNNPNVVYSSCGNGKAGYREGHNNVLASGSGYSSDTNTAVSQTHSAYDMILKEGSATGLHSSDARMKGGPYSKRANAHSAPESTANGRVPHLPRSRGVWHDDIDANSSVEKTRALSKKHRKASASPHHAGVSSERPRTARRSTSYDNLDKKELLDSKESPLPKSHRARQSKHSKKSRPISAKR